MTIKPAKTVVAAPPVENIKGVAVFHLAGAKDAVVVETDANRHDVMVG